MSGRLRAIPYGGIGMMHKLAKKVGLVEQVDAGLHLLRMHEGDHRLFLTVGDCHMIAAGHLPRLDDHIVGFTPDPCNDGVACLLDTRYLPDPDLIRLSLKAVPPSSSSRR